ncbi:hypothetical protein R75461_04985 [Paraburkholderia nemoris]|nr:hypothetical protein R75461_04985 [Paraburkholderia nemoris]
MSLAVVRSRAPASGRAPEVTVEVHLANGLPSFSIVGLPDLEVRESRERVRAALQNCSFDFPVRRITVTLQGFHSTPWTRQKRPWDKAFRRMAVMSMVGLRMAT